MLAPLVTPFFEHQTPTTEDALVWCSAFLGTALVTTIVAAINMSVSDDVYAREIRF